MTAPDTTGTAGTDSGSSDPLYTAARETVAHVEQLNAMLRDHATVVHNTNGDPRLAAHAIFGGAQ